ncbi:MAG: FHA domain-containing protein [Chloroflexota bacterium]
MTINLQDGLVLWVIPAVLAITALLLLFWWIALLIAPPPRARVEQPHRSPPPTPTPVPSSSKRVRPAPAIPDDYHTNLGGSGNIGKFVVMAGLDVLSDLPLPGNSFGIGRFPDEGSNVLIALDEKSISRKHAQLRFDPATGSYFLHDTSSTYGTFLVENNQPRQLPAGKEERVYNQDIIQFGQVVRVRLVVPSDTRDIATRV